MAGHQDDRGWVQTAKGGLRFRVEGIGFRVLRVITVARVVRVIRVVRVRGLGYQGSGFGV